MLPIGRPHQVAELLAHFSQENPARRVTIEVPISLIVQVQRPSIGHHRFKHRILFSLVPLSGLFQRYPRSRLAWMRLESLVRGKIDTLSDTKVSIGVVEIDMGKDIPEESFGALEPIFQGFYILRGWIASPIGWLVIGAVCVQEYSASCIQELPVHIPSSAIRY